jgi:hypothetical protein
MSGLNTGSDGEVPPGVAQLIDCLALQSNREINDCRLLNLESEAVEILLLCKYLACRDRSRESLSFSGQTCKVVVPAVELPCKSPGMVSSPIDLRVKLSSV